MRYYRVLGYDDESYIFTDLNKAYCFIIQTMIDFQDFVKKYWLQRISDTRLKIWATDPETGKEVVMLLEECVNGDEYTNNSY